MLLGLTGALIGVALPFAPVWADASTLTWPVTGQPVHSATVVVVPYRPVTLAASVPCSALRAAAQGGPSVVALATGSGSEGLVVTGGSARFDGGTVVALPTPADAAADCRAQITADAHGVSVTAPDGRRTELPNQQVPEVFGFRTDLAPPAAAGTTVTVGLTDPFATSPSSLKIALIGAQLLAVAAALILLGRDSRRRPRWHPSWPARLRWPRVWWIDVAVVAVLAGWAVIGPLAVDDGWATMIARNVAETGSPGNYYRWWNAAEVPFALDQQLLSPLTQISLAPLWLRLPSTVLAIATWLALSRGVLGAALRSTSRTPPVRLLAAGCMLAAWLPFNLGTRPESYVALGVTLILALAMRSRTLAGLGWLALTAALTVPISPNAVLVAAPIVVFAPRLLAVLRSHSPTRADLLAHALLLCCVGAVGLTVIFADQSWDAFGTATDWHTFFGPALPWYQETLRYRYLLQADQQGSMAKRLPVLLSMAMLAVVALSVARHRDRDDVGGTAARLAVVTLVALGLFAASPSKWSYHLGAAAGLFAALLTVGVVLVVRRARAPDRYRIFVGLGGSALLLAAVSLAFQGPNAWWLPIVYDVPWAAQSPRPLGIPLNNPLVWVVVVGVVSALIALRHRSAVASAGSPAVVVCTAVGVVLALLLGSFIAAPLRRSDGSLAMINVHGLTGSKVCGLADDVQVLPDGPPLSASTHDDELAGFTALGGYPATAPPPDPPGTGTSTYQWGSQTPNVQATGTMTSRWFVLPPQPANGGVAVSVAGRTDQGNALIFEFGRADDESTSAPIISLGDRMPVDRPAADENPAHPLWRSIGIDAADFPAGADRIRIRAVDHRADQSGWLAVTGPRLRTAVGLTAFLASNGPVLINWPEAFLFPCIRDIATVSAGVGTTPRTVIESPRPFFTDDRKHDIGGTFAALATFGDLHEVPSRLVGHPELDWGSVQVSGDPAGRDAYQRTRRRTLVPGAGGVTHQRPEH